MINNRFCFITPTYNMSKTLPMLLHSICGQSYDNWRIIIIDDVSDQYEFEDTSHVIKEFSYLMEYKYKNKIDFIWNNDKKWEVANVLKGIEMCEDNDIICRIDGDDWLTELDALTIINDAYNQTNCDLLWTAHRWGYSDKNISGPLPKNVDPYKYPWVSSHLKTFKKYLLNNVNDINFRGPDGDYIKRCGDQAIYLPAIANSQKHIFLPRVMYHYTIDDVPETYQTSDALFQRDEALFLRDRGFVI